MSITLSQRSLTRLDGAHPDLRRVIIRAAAMSSIDFTVLEVLRTRQRQEELLRIGATRTRNSRHLAHPSDGKSRAVDIAPMVRGQVTWDWPLYHRLAPIIKAAAAAETVPIEWGGDWRSFKDGPHWQLPWAQYP